MNLDELRTVQSKERQKDSLQHLRPSFYQEVGDYIEERKRERDRIAEEADDPFSSPEVGRLTDEIETAKDVVEAIYERRMGKLVKQASLAAAGMPADDEGLTAEEADLFEDLVDRIESNKGRVLDVLEGAEADSSDEGADQPADTTRPAPDGESDSTAPPAPPEEPPTPESPSTDDPARPDPGAGPGPEAGESTEHANAASDADGVSVADAMGDDLNAADAGPDRTSDLEESGSDEAPAPPDPDHSETDDSPRRESDGGDPPDVDRTTVRITRDVGSILGIDDREYTLASDDVVTLPERNAEPLVERDAAEPLE